MREIFYEKLEIMLFLRNGIINKTGKIHKFS